MRARIVRGAARRASVGAGGVGGSVLALGVSWVLALGTVGCGSARIRDREADRLWRSGQYAAAAERLEQGAAKQGEGGKDLLLYLLDQGTAWQQAGDFAKSIRAFAQADRIAEIRDYTSLSTEAFTLLSSDNQRPYGGEEFEIVLISTMQAINYSLLGDSEGALVEARRVNSKLYRLINETKRSYQQSAFARWLSGALFESDGDWNNALVSYRQGYELIASRLGAERAEWCGSIWRMTVRLGMGDLRERYERECGLDGRALARELKDRTQAKWGEAVLLFQNGLGPRKIPNPNWYSLPVFAPQYNPARAARLSVEGQGARATVLLDDIEAVAIANLEQKYGALVAKKIAAAVAKEAVAQSIDAKTKRRGWGDLARIAMYLSDQPDLRSWLWLPRDLQMARLPLPPGTHTLKIEVLGPTDAVLSTRSVTIAVPPGRSVFVSERFVPAGA